MLSSNNRGRGSHPAFHSIALAGVLMALLGTGCSLSIPPDRICQADEYPVKAAGSLSGGACVTNGQPVPAGFVRYPKGKVPQHVDDKWDKYWNTVVVDGNGNLVDFDVDMDGNVTIK